MKKVSGEIFLKYLKFPKWINQVHLEGWKLGIKTFYYLRTDSVIKGDLGSRMADCISCDG